MSYSIPKGERAGVHIPLINQIAPILGFAIGASGIIPTLTGQSGGTSIGGDYGSPGDVTGKSPMTSAPRPGDDFSGGPGHYGGGPGYGGPGSIGQTATAPTVPPMAANGAAPNLVAGGALLPKPAAAPVPPTGNVPAAAPPAAAPPAPPATDPKMATGGALAQNNLPDLLKNIGGLGGLGGITGLGGSQTGNQNPLQAALAGPQISSAPAMPTPSYSGGTRGGNLGSLGMAPTRLSQFGGPLGPASVSPLFLQQLRVLGLA